MRLACIVFLEEHGVQSAQIEKDKYTLTDSKAQRGLEV
jgi:hypothetical protein